VHPETQLVRKTPDVLHVRARQDGSAGQIVRVLENDEPRARHVDIIRAHRSAQEIEGHEAAFPRQRHGLHAMKRRQAALFEAIDVTALLEQDLISRARVHTHGHLVGHGAGRQEQRRLFAEHGGTVRFEFAHRRIVSEHIVANHGATHGLAHGGCGASDRVASEIVHAVQRAPKRRSIRERASLMFSMDVA
jgi:hypothetical protein